jgi:hypothetical protein
VSSEGGGLGAAGTVTLVLVVLKLTGVIDWSWWWVFAPAWIVTLIAVLVAAGCLVLIRGVKRSEEYDAEMNRRRALGLPLPHEHGPAVRRRPR